MRPSWFAAAVVVPAILVATQLGAQSGSTASYSSRVVTVAVDVGAAGREYHVTAYPGATLVGPPRGTSRTTNVFVSLHLASRLRPGRQAVATVMVSGREAVPVMVDVPEARRLVLRGGAVSISLTPGGRDTVSTWLVNLGNVSETVDLSARAESQVQVQVRPSESVRPGDSSASWRA